MSNSNKQIQINSIAEARSFSQELIRAPDFIPDSFRNNSHAIMAALIRGKELGLSPMASLSSMHVVKGKVELSYSAIVGLLKINGYKVIWKETDNEKAIVTIKSDGDELITVKYTIDDAKVAGLAGKDTWKKHPASMLRARAVSNAARAVAGDIFCGCYSADEIEEIRDSQKTHDVTPVKSASEAARLARRRKKEEEPPEPIEIIEEGQISDPVSDLSIDDMMLDIGGCQDIDALNEYARNLKGLNLSEDDVNRLRDVYAIRKEELQQQGVL